VIIKAEQRVGVRDDETLEMAKDIVCITSADGTGYARAARPAFRSSGGLAVVDV
jgi:hypothetical protein